MTNPPNEILADTQALMLNDRVMFTEVDDEYVLLHLDKGEYFSLNSMGVVLFNMLKGGSSMADVHDEILSTYDIDQETLSTDLKELIISLTANQILLPRNEETSLHE